MPDLLQQISNATVKETQETRSLLSTASSGAMGSAILLVHKEPRIRDAARRALELEGYSVTAAKTFDTPCDAPSRPAVILLPLAASRLAREWFNRMRDQDRTQRSRVIVWASPTDVREAVNSADFGADDFLGIPFDDSELIARVNLSLRRPAVSTWPYQLTAGPLALDKSVHSVRVRNHPVNLAPTEFRLLTFLLENPGRVHSRAELLKSASKDKKASERTVDVHVRRLRQILEPFGCEQMIQTVHGFGYRFDQSGGTDSVAKR